MSHIIVTTGILPSQSSRQRGHEALCRKCKQTPVRYLIETMAERVVAAQSQSAPLLGINGLQTGIAAVGIRAELVHITEALVEGLLIRKGREASIADRLIAVELHLERLM